MKNEQENQPMIAKYVKGYFVPIELPVGRFNAKRDRGLIESGKYFYCKGHLCAVPIENQSQNLDYCSDCLEAMK